MTKKKNVERVGVKCEKCGNWSWVDVTVQATITEMDLKVSVTDAPKVKK